LSVGDGSEPPTGGEAAEGSAPAAEGLQTSDFRLQTAEALLPGELPVAQVQHELRDAVGLPPEPRSLKPDRTEDDPDADADPDSVARRRRTIIVSTVAIVVGLTIATLVFLGRANGQRYFVVCGSDHVAAEQGRGFPPWGSRSLGGPEWKAIPLPPNATCKPGEVDDIHLLTGRYLEILIAQASASLGAHDLLDRKTDGKGASELDVAAAELEQALLLSRDPDWHTQREQVEHLLGDVEYWRASQRLREAAAALTDASKQFDAASARHPAHVKDSSAWATLVRRIAGELHAGPAGDAEPLIPMPTGETHVTAPPGVALPVEPPPAGSAAEPPPPSAPDAGVPTGGVLL
jgi:hypothetical protein